MRKEPILHCDNDRLPEDHPNAWEVIRCVGCTETLHCSTNEKMQVWVETSRGNFCLECFKILRCEVCDGTEEFGWNE